MYDLRKGTELFGKIANIAVLKELSQVDKFETYKSKHKHELSKKCRKNPLESMMKITEKREDEEGNIKIK